jgi:hypothetical protein
MNGLRDFSSKDKQGDRAGSVPVPDEMPEFLDWAKYRGMEKILLRVNCQKY